MKLNGLRSFPHSNSKRKQADRYKSDIEEISQYTSTLPTLRNGKQECPDCYNDVWKYSYTKKYATKPKANNVDRDTIRRGEDYDVDDWDAE